MPHGTAPSAAKPPAKSNRWRERIDMRIENDICFPDTGRRAGGGWGRGRPVRDDSGKRKPAENHLFSIIYNPAALQQAAPPEVTRCLFRRSCATSGGAASCRAQADG